MNYESLINVLEEVLLLAKNKNGQIKILKAEVERLNGVVIELQEQVDNKESNIVLLNGKIAELEEVKTQLEERIVTLETEKSQLEVDKATLQSEKETLIGEKNQLETDKTYLQNQVVELEQSKLDAEVQHQAEVDALNAKIAELKKILATD